MDAVAEWDRQQELYIEGREERFDALLDVVEWHSHEHCGGRPPTVVDLACGPAAIGTRLLTRTPGATYIGLDIDPVLLHLARTTTARFTHQQVRIVDASIAGDGWTDHVPSGDVDIVCSSTALHWLTPDELAGTLRAAHDVLRPGGVLLNADHLGFGRQSSFQQLADWKDRGHIARRTAEGIPTWDTWWAAIRADPTMTELCRQRDLVYRPAPSGDGARPLLDDFVATARAAGFAEVATVWQRFDNHLVMAIKPPTP
jgi:SAM-dependent methyltransferase